MPIATLSGACPQRQPLRPQLRLMPPELGFFSHEQATMGSLVGSRMMSIWRALTLQPGNSAGTVPQLNSRMCL